MQEAHSVSHFQKAVLKIGPLPQNKLTLGDPFCLGNVATKDIILSGALASRAENNDTIDLAVLGGLKDNKA